MPASAVTTIMFVCPNCAIPPFRTLKKLLRHIRLSHSDQECFRIQCNLQGCNRTFRNLRTFENHIYGYHDVTTVDEIRTEETDLPDRELGGTNDEEAEIETEDFETESEVQGPGIFCVQGVCVFMYIPKNVLLSSNHSQLSSERRWFAHTKGSGDNGTIKTRESHRIPISVMESIIYDVQSLVDVVVSSLSSQVQTCLQSSGVSQGVVENVGSIFSNCPRVFAGLQTQQQQLSFFRKNFSFVVSL